MFGLALNSYLSLNLMPTECKYHFKTWYVFAGARPLAVSFVLFGLLQHHLDVLNLG